MAAITGDKADKIMRSINYFLWVHRKGPDGEQERLYTPIDPSYDDVRIVIRIRLSDASFQFMYHNPKSENKLESTEFGPVTNKSHFMEQYNKFMAEATHYDKYFKTIQE